MRTVLITDFSSYKSVVVARFVRRAYPSVRIATCDTRAYTARLRSRHTDRHHVLDAASVADPQYVDELARLAGEVGADVVIPANSQELGPLLAGRERFGSRLAYWGTVADYERLHNKDRLAELLAGSGVRVPRSFTDLVSVVPPVVVKPTSASSSKGVRYAWTAADVARIAADIGREARGHVVQEFVAGDGAGLSGFFVEGRMAATFAHMRLAEYPASGGSSVYRGPLADPREEAAVREAVTGVLSRVPWSGFAMFEFKRTPDGSFVLIECNPRIWGSIHQGLMAGVNYLEPLLGPAEVPLAARPHVRTYLSPLLYVAFAQYAARGELGRAAGFVANAMRNRSDISVYDDPLGWLGLLRRAG